MTVDCTVLKSLKIVKTVFMTHKVTNDWPPIFLILNLLSFRKWTICMYIINNIVHKIAFF